MFLWSSISFRRRSYLCDNVLFVSPLFQTAPTYSCPNLNFRPLSLGLDSDVRERGDIPTRCFSAATSLFFLSGAGLAGDEIREPKIINCPHCGRALPKEFWHEKSQAYKVIVECPRCSSTRNWKDAKRYSASGVLQRYYCRDCGRRFSKP
jgi:DNA-directed RNA polymerase subunit RPC12/RpoP